MLSNIDTGTVKTKTKPQNPQLNNELGGQKGSSVPCEDGRAQWEEKKGLFPGKNSDKEKS